MNRLLFVVLGAVCFAAGWWLDAWAGETGEVISDGGKQEAPPAKSEPVEVKAAASPGASSGIVPITGIQSVEDFLKLNVAGRRFASRVQLLRAAAGLSVAELAEFAAKLKEMGKSPDADWSAIHEALVAVVDRWLTVDPEPAAAFAVRHRQGLLAGDENIIGPRFREAVAKLFRDDLQAAIRVMSNFPDRDAYIDVRLDAIDAIKEMDPKAGLERIFEFDAKTRNDRYGAQVLGEFPRQWAEKNPQEAINWALTLPACFTRRQILRYTAMEWAKLDTDAAAAFVSGIPVTALPAGDLRTEIMKSIESERKTSATPQ